jgi:hypothetical protein
MNRTREKWALFPRLCLREILKMATRDRRLAEFDGAGEPPPGLPVEVLCEDHSGTYQLPFACRYVEGRWQNDAAGVPVEATVIGWRVPRVKHSGLA